jgi:release factor glutamine methyltransferase
LPTPEARALLAKTLSVAREAIVAHPERLVDPASAQRFGALMARRLAGEPLAYLLGECEFYGRAFRVTRDVLIPRPETELLVDLALSHARQVDHPRFLDLGTGSGCIAISIALERPDADVTAVDVSERALAIARENAARLGARVEFRRSDWYSDVAGRFDLIVANPPYVAEGDPHLADLGHEPPGALVATDHGLAPLRTIIGNTPRHLQPNGWLLIEHGYDQAAAVRNLFASKGFTSITSAHDAANIERVSMGTLPPA